MLIWLPESLQFMALRGKSPKTLARWLNQIDPGVNASAADQFVVREENKPGIPIIHLFREGRAVPTDPVLGRQFHELAESLLARELAANRRA